MNSDYQNDAKSIQLTDLCTTIATLSLSNLASNMKTSTSECSSKTQPDAHDDCHLKFQRMESTVANELKTVDSNVKLLITTVQNLTADFKRLDRQVYNNLIVPVKDEQQKKEVFLKNQQQMKSYRDISLRPNTTWKRQEDTKGIIKPSETNEIENSPKMKNKIPSATKNSLPSEGIKPLEDTQREQAPNNKMREILSKTYIENATETKERYVTSVNKDLSNKTRSDKAIEITSTGSSPETKEADITSTIEKDMSINSKEIKLDPTRPTMIDDKSDSITKTFISAMKSPRSKLSDFFRRNAMQNTRTEDTNQSGDSTRKTSKTADNQSVDKPTHRAVLKIQILFL